LRQAITLNFAQLKDIPLVKQPIEPMKVEALMEEFA
jgi:hypothetical protein